MRKTETQPLLQRQWTLISPWDKNIFALFGRRQGGLLVQRRTRGFPETASVDIGNFSQL